MMVVPPDLEQLRESVRRMGPNWVDTDPNFKASWWSIPDRDFQPFADAARFLLSVVESGGRLVVEQPCEHGALEPHGWVCGEHDTDEKCPRQNCGAYLDFGEHCPQLHRNDDACWSAPACGGGSRRVVWPKEEA